MKSDRLELSFSQLPFSPFSPCLTYPERAIRRGDFRRENIVRCSDMGSIPRAMLLPRLKLGMEWLLYGLWMLCRPDLALRKPSLEVPLSTTHHCRMERNRLARDCGTHAWNISIEVETRPRPEVPVRVWLAKHDGHMSEGTHV